MAEAGGLKSEISLANKTLPWNRFYEGPVIDSPLTGCLPSMHRALASIPNTTTYEWVSFLIVTFVKYLFTLHGGDECGRDHEYPMSEIREYGDLSPGIGARELGLWADPLASLGSCLFIWIQHKCNWAAGVQCLTWRSVAFMVTCQNPLWFRILWIAMLVSYWGSAGGWRSFPENVQKGFEGRLLFPLSLCLLSACTPTRLCICPVNICPWGMSPRPGTGEASRLPLSKTSSLAFLNLNPNQGRLGRHMGTQIPNTFFFETSSHVSEAHPILLYRLRPASSSHIPATPPWPQVLPPHLIYLVLSIQPTASFLPSRHSTKWATSPDLRGCFHFSR